MEKKNILIVDDSALMRRIESDIINSDERFQVTDTANDGLQAFDFITSSSKKYDAIILDINMPRMNGIEFLEALEKKKIKQKIIVVSTIAVQGAAETIRALELGAFDYLTKPGSFVDAMKGSFKEMLLQLLAYATGVATDSAKDLLKGAGQPAVSGRTETGGTLKTPARPQAEPAKDASKPQAEVKTNRAGAVSPMNPRAILAEGFQPRRPHKAVSGAAKRLIIIASSTGGPKALQQVVPKIPKNINAPVIIVQHMSEGFTKSLAARLNELSEISVVEAQGGEKLQKGVAYLARGGSQMRLKKTGGDYVLDVNSQEPARNGLKPCADIMFESVDLLDFDDITCTVLTGMGGDGTLGIGLLNKSKNIYVIAQDEQTSTVYGMPKVVYEAGLVDAVKPLTLIAEEITKNVGVQ